MLDWTSKLQSKPFDSKMIPDAQVRCDPRMSLDTSCLLPCMQIAETDEDRSTESKGRQRWTTSDRSREKERQTKADKGRQRQTKAEKGRARGAKEHCVAWRAY